MEKKLLNLNRVLELLKKQYTSDFYIVWRCVKEDNILKNKAVITVFSEIVAVTFEEDINCYRVSYNFNNKFWYKYVYDSGHGVAFSPLFNEEDTIDINGETYINEDIIKKWQIFSPEEYGTLN